MTNKKYLEMELRLSVRKFGENDPVTLGIKRQLQEIEQRTLSGQSPEILQFQAGFRAHRRKAQKPQPKSTLKRRELLRRLSLPYDLPQIHAYARAAAA
jgi:hypothetical protein